MGASKNTPYGWTALLASKFRATVGRTASRRPGTAHLSLSLIACVSMTMTSSETGAAQHPPPPSLPSPGQPPPPPQEQQADEASDLAVPTSEAEASCRAIRSSFPSQMQNGETAIEVAKGSESVTSGDKHFRGAWKDEWVVSLIHLRGSMDDEFMKPQKSGIDMWSRVSTQITEAHDDFDKNSESCRKKWQRVYKSFKDNKALVAAPGGDKQVSCKWFDLVDHYMHDHVDRNSNAIGSDEPVPMEEVTHTDLALIVRPNTGVSGDHSGHHTKANVKRARRDQKVKESLSQMVETWRESLEVLKDSEAKRLEILQRLSTTMTGLLDILRK